MSVIPGLNELPDHTATAGLVAVVILGTAYVARRQLSAASIRPFRTAHDRPQPDGDLRRELHRSRRRGDRQEAQQYAPSHGALFFILLCNLIGLIPGFTPPTSNVNTTLGPVSSFIVYNYYGFKAHGLAYLKHFVGPIWWLVVLMLPLELIDNFLRPITLNLRLMMNMFADHLVLDIFTDLTRLIVPVVATLGAFVSVIRPSSSPSASTSRSP
jgi:hypothetical protein